MFYVADHVDTIGKLDRVDPTMGDVHPQGNPHVHLDPYRLLTISQSLAERLASIDPENAHTYRSNAKAFSNRMGRKYSTVGRASPTVARQTGDWLSHQL